MNNVNSTLTNCSLASLNLLHYVHVNGAHFYNITCLLFQSDTATAFAAVKVYAILLPIRSLVTSTVFRIALLKLS